MVGYVFDDTVLTALGNGDHVASVLLASLDARHVRVCVPAVTLSYSFAVLPKQAIVDLFSLIEAMDNTAVDPLADTESALDLAEFVELLPDDASAAHALTSARKHDMLIATTDLSRWREVEQRLGSPLPVALIDDPDDE